MAGYIFNLDSVESLRLYFKNGVYSTKLSPPTIKWRQHHEATFADYVTMKNGDNVYFFIRRKIYGIGKLINIVYDCKYCNYPGSSEPVNREYEDIKEKLLWDEGIISVNQRWICTFKPDPFFFEQGIDMDDVLSSNPDAFKMLRAFWKVSFIKFDDIENQAFKDALIKINHKFLKQKNGEGLFATSFSDKHEAIRNKLRLGNYSIEAKPILETCSKGDIIEHAMALEAGILTQLSKKDKDTIKVFSDWDYLSHQVIASPFKPIDYMDKMDIFGYSYISGYSPTRSKYLIIEIKKDTCSLDNVVQLMKYVDWVNKEYCYGDYNMIDAFLVGYDFQKEVLGTINDIVSRKYIIGMKPVRSLEWKNVNLVKYSYNKQTSSLDFEIIDYE